MDSIDIGGTEMGGCYRRTGAILQAARSEVVPPITGEPLRAHRLGPSNDLPRAVCRQREFETTAPAFRIATSVGGVLTGRGADIIVIDDCHSSMDWEPGRHRPPIGVGSQSGGTDPQGRARQRTPRQYP
jgi:hypothetical protein